MTDFNFNYIIPSALQYHPGSDSASYCNSPSRSMKVRFTYLAFITPQQRIKVTGHWGLCFSVSGEHSMEGYFAEKCKRTFRKSGLAIKEMVSEMNLKRSMW